MGEFVTPHAPITNGVEGQGPTDWRYLLHGFDTVDLGVYVAWQHEDFDEFMGRLAVQKMLAGQHDGSLLWKDGPLESCLVCASGKGANYPFHLQLHDMHLWLARQQKPDSLPNVYVSPSAQLLKLAGVCAAVENVRGVIEQLGGQVLDVQVSRADLHADFAIPGGLSFDFIRHHLVGKPRHSQAITESNELETFYLGRKKSPVQLRIYNKSRHISKHLELRWLFDLYNTEHVFDVWRIEYQLRRDWLRERLINSVDDLIQHAHAIWHHLTAEWMSLRLHDDSNTSRRSVHPFWQHVHNVCEDFGPKASLGRLSKPPVDLPADWYVSRMRGSLLRYAVRRGVPDLFDAVERLSKELLSSWSPGVWLDEFERMRIELGLAGLTHAEEGGEDVPF